MLEPTGQRLSGMNDRTHLVVDQLILIRLQQELIKLVEIGVPFSRSIPQSRQSKGLNDDWSSRLGHQTSGDQSPSWVLGCENDFLKSTAIVSGIVAPVIPRIFCN